MEHIGTDLLSIIFFVLKCLFVIDWNKLDFKFPMKRHEPHRRCKYRRD